MKQTTLTRLFSYCREQKKVLLWGGFWLMVATASEVSGPFLIKIFIDDYLTPMDLAIQPVIGLALGYFALQLLSAFAAWLQSVFFSQGAERIILTIRKQVFDTAMYLPIRYYDRAQTGQILSRITNDTQAIATFYEQVIKVFLQNFALLISTMIAMALLNWKMMLICVLALPLLLMVTLIYKRLCVPLFRKERALLGDINARIGESLQGIDIIRLLTQEIRFAREFASLNDEHRIIREKSIHLDGLLLRPFVDFIESLAIVGLLWLFVTPSLSGGIQIGVLYAFLNYLGRMIEPINEIMGQITQLQRSIIASERVFILMDETIEVNATVETKVSDGEVDFKNVHFAYNEPHFVLKAVEFSLRRGKMLAIVGPTGSGKSSIINLLMGFYRPQQGMIWVDGQSMDSLNLHQMRRHIGLVQQDPFIFVGSLAENISLGRDGVDEIQIWRALQRVQLAEYVRSLPEGLATQMEEGGRNFSAGQRQLLSFARALVTEPHLLILDEATASVDSQTEAKLQRILTELRQQCSLLAVAHRLSTIADADEILLLAHGEVLERGRHGALMEQNGHYANLYQLQQQGVALERDQTEALA